MYTKQYLQRSSWAGLNQVRIEFNKGLKLCSSNLSTGALKFARNLNL
jgi:hypothetical protein